MKREEAKPLGVILEQLIKEVGLTESLERIDIFNAWDNAVGERVASVTIGKFFRDGTLFCTISSSMIRNQLYYQLESIKNKINSELAGFPVKKIVLK